MVGSFLHHSSLPDIKHLCEIPSGSFPAVASSTGGIYNIYDIYRHFSQFLWTWVTVNALRITVRVNGWCSGLDHGLGLGLGLAQFRQYYRHSSAIKITTVTAFTAATASCLWKFIAPITGWQTYLMFNLLYDSTITGARECRRRTHLNF